MSASDSTPVEALLFVGGVFVLVLVLLVSHRSRSAAFTGGAVAGVSLWFALRRLSARHRLVRGVEGRHVWQAQAAQRRAREQSGDTVEHWLQ